VRDLDYGKRPSPLPHVRLVQSIPVQLFCLVLIPALLSLWFSVGTVTSAHRSFQTAQAIKRSIPTLDALLQLDSAVRQEMGTALAMAYAAQLTEPAPSATKPPVIPPILASSRADVDRRLARVDSLAPELLGSFSRSLAAARASLALAAGTAKVDAEYSRLDAQLAMHQRQQGATLTDRAQDLGGRNQMVAALAALDALNATADSRSTQLLTLVDLAHSGGHPTPATIARLAEATVLLKQAAEKLRTSPIPAIAQLWRSEARDPRALQADRAMGTYLAGVTPSGFDPLQTAANYAALTVPIWLGTLSTADATLTEHASQTAHRASVTLWSTILIWLLCLLVVLAFALRASRSIGTPVRELALHAREVGRGRLPTREVRIRGPREVRQVTQAFQELTASMNLLEEKNLALAAMDWDSDALSKELPGQLGRSIDASVRVLSESVVERERHAQQLAYKATHDSLTGLPNRSAALVVAERALARTARSGSPIAFLYLDLDGFKSVNDTHGHRIGDELLKETCARMTAMARGGDVIARLGGDEFLIVAEDTEVAEALALGRRLVEAVAAPMELDHRRLEIGASIGISVSTDGTQTFDDLLGQADAALYRAKDAGRGRIELFDPARPPAIPHGVHRETSLRAALHRRKAELSLDL
jgi:diguanylate cyclase (GGDEF)-like protein